MLRSAVDLAGTVKALRPFIPANDFSTSKEFYSALGFIVEPLGDGLAHVSIGPHCFLLRKHSVDAGTDTFIMHMMVDDIGAWWAHIRTLDLVSCYGVRAPRAPKRESWGMMVAYLFDPSGVLWHIAEVQPRA